MGKSRKTAVSYAETTTLTTCSSEQKGYAENEKRMKCTVKEKGNERKRGKIRRTHAVFTNKTT